MRKTAKPSSIADKFHKGFVWTCIGISAWGLYIGAFRFYHYLTVVRPSRLAIKENLLKEEEREPQQYHPAPPIIDPEELKN